MYLYFMKLLIYIYLNYIVNFYFNWMFSKPKLTILFRKYKFVYFCTYFFLIAHTFFVIFCKIKFIFLNKFYFWNFNAIAVVSTTARSLSECADDKNHFYTSTNHPTDWLSRSIRVFLVCVVVVVSYVNRERKKKA